MVKAGASVFLIPIVRDHLVTFVVGDTFIFPAVLLSKLVLGAEKCWKETNFQTKAGSQMSTLWELSPLLDLQVWGDSG